ncbi:FREE1-like protein [Drosera capensis]
MQYPSDLNPPHHPNYTPYPPIPHAPPPMPMPTPPFNSASAPPPPPFSASTSDYSLYPQNPDPIAFIYPNPTPPPPPPPEIPQYPFYDHHTPPQNPNSIYPYQFSNVNSSPSLYDLTPYPRIDPGPTGYLNEYDRLGFDERNERGVSASVIDYGSGVHAYPERTEPYGTGLGKKDGAVNGSVVFDDYGRAIGGAEREKERGSGSGGVQKVVARAVPKAEMQGDVKSGVVKFRVKLLPESGGQGAMDVLCQVGLDGIRMIDPNTSRTLRIYPLEIVSRCEFKEMGGRSRPSDVTVVPERGAEKKKGFGEWMSILKPANEEKDHWVPDEAASKCTACGTDFSAFIRRHHCRNCGDIFCDKCTHGRIPLTADENAQPVRVCDRCMAEVTQRLSRAKEAASKPALLSHEDLAKKLQDELERNRRGSSGRRMKEVACPTCTVRLQVQVPASGSETIECGVCQHPFLVSAH